MANIITQFLIALGFDTSDLNRGEREVNRSMGSVRTTVTAAGAAMTAAFVGVGNIALDTADRVNKLRLSTNTLNTSVTFVNDYGNAIRSLGGNASDAVSEITRVEDALMKLRTRGDASTFTELAYAGVDVAPLEQAESGGEFMQELARQFPSLDRQQQMSVQQTLGLSPASVELLRKGADGYREIFRHVNDVAGLTPELVSSAQEYNRVLTETQLKWEGIKNTITQAVLPAMTDIVRKGSEVLGDVVAPMAEKHPEATGAGISMLGAGVLGTAAGPLLGAVGMGGLSAVTSAVAPPVALAGAGTLAWNMGQKDVENLTGYKLPAWLWDKKVFDESQGDTAGGLLHSNSFIGEKWNQIVGNDSGQSDDTQQSMTPSVTNNAPIVVPPAGGNVTNNYTQSAPYSPKVISQDYNPAATSANTTGKAVADELRNTPIQVRSTIQNNLNVELDGRALEAKIRDVNQRDNQSTVDDLRSTTAR